MQNVKQLPSFSINAFANGITLFVYTPMVFLLCLVTKLRKDEHVEDTQSVSSIESAEGTSQELALVDESDPAPFESKEIKTTTCQQVTHYVLVFVITTVTIVVFCACRLAKSIGNLLASKFTASINTQLVSISAPFMVTAIIITVTGTHALVICLMYGKKHAQFMLPLDWKMAASMITTVAGAVFIILGRFSAQEGRFTWTVDFSHLGQVSKDFISTCIGILISIAGNFLGAWYTVLLPFLNSQGNTIIHRYNKFRLNGVNLNYFQTFVVFFFCLIISLSLKEDWSRWLSLDVGGWIVFLIYTLLVYVLCELFNVLGTQMLGSITASATMPTSLIATVLLSWIVLNEVLNNLWQIIGIILVLIGVTLFIIFRNLLVQKQAIKPSS
jgi:drug/metabolite transporter (DMT)-like permease